jgi:hypothetical protein
MKKKTKIVLWVIGVILALVIIGFVLVETGVLQKMGISQVIYPSGTCGATMSISEGYVNANGENLYSKSFLADVTLNGGGDCAKIVWSKDELTKYVTDEGYVIDNGVYGYFNLDSEKLIYNAIADAPVRKMKYGSWTTLVTNCNTNSIASHLGISTSDVVAYKYLGTIAGYCAYITAYNYGDAAHFGAKSKTDWSATVSIDGAGSTTLTDENPSGSISDKVYIKWKGNLLTNSYVSTPTQRLFLSNNQITITSIDAMSNIYSQFNVKSSNAKDTCALYTCLQNVVDSYNSYVDSQLVDKTSSLESEIGLETNSITKSGSTITVDITPTLNSYPTFVVEIKAAWVGIHSVCAAGTLTCPTNTFDIKTATPTTFSFSTKNTDASSSGSYNLNINCPSAFGSISQRVDLVAGASKTLTGTLNYFSSTDSTNKCTITMTNANPTCSSNTQTCYIYYHGIAQQCVSDTKTCDSSGNLLTCINGQYSITNCQYGCEYVNGVSKCKEAPSSCTTDADCNQTCYICNSQKKCVLDETCGRECKGSWLIPASISTTETCSGTILLGIPCELGIVKKNTVNSCVRDYSLLLIILGVITIIIIVLIIVLASKQARKTYYRGSRR